MSKPRPWEFSEPVTWALRGCPHLHGSLDESAERCGSAFSEQVIAVLAIGHADGTGPGLPGEERGELRPGLVAVTEGVDHVEVFEAAREVLLPGIDTWHTDGQQSGQ